MIEKQGNYNFMEAIKATFISFRDFNHLIVNGCPSCGRGWVAQIKFGTFVYQCPECGVEFVKYDPREGGC